MLLKSIVDLDFAKLDTLAHESLKWKGLRRENFTCICPFHSGLDNCFR
uniref:Uncharacterized protein n=1 Tax=Rhizophora mucronata TaxID=61149 RepID=A0A2P2IRX0_RHIMU